MKYVTQQLHYKLDEYTKHSKNFQKVLNHRQFPRHKYAPKKQSSFSEHSYVMHWILVTEFLFKVLTCSSLPEFLLDSVSELLPSPSEGNSEVVEHFKWRLRRPTAEAPCDDIDDGAVRPRLWNRPLSPVVKPG